MFVYIHKQRNEKVLLETTGNCRYCSIFIPLPSLNTTLQFKQLENTIDLFIIIISISFGWIVVRFVVE